MPMGVSPQTHEPQQQCAYTFHPEVEYGKWSEAQFLQLQTVFILLFFLVVFWFILTLRKNRGWYSKEDR